MFSFRGIRPVLILLGFFGYLLSSGAAAQTGNPAFIRLGLEQGLSHESIRCLLQDREGFLWIGTESGLNRYDGARVRTYRHRAGDASTVPADWIHSLYEDRDGTLWIGTTGGGIARYDRRTDSFQSFSKGLENREGTNLAVNRMYEDRNGAFWICTPFDLIRFDRKTGALEHFQAPSREIVQSILVVLEDQAGTFWVGTSEGLWTFDRVSGQFSLVERMTWKGLFQIGVTDLALHPDGRLFVTTWSGLRVFDTRTRHLLTVFGKTPGGLASDHLQCLRLADANTLLIGSDDAGIDRLNLATGETTHVPHDPKNPESLPGNSVRTLLLDRSGILWVGDASYGLGKSSPFSHRFRLYRSNPQDSNSLSDNYIRGILLDSENMLWVATQTAGLNRVDRRIGNVTRFRANPNDPRALPSDNIRTVFEDHAKTLWIGTEGGLCRFDRSTNSIARVHNVGADEAVNTISEDRAGNLWFNGDRGVVRLDPDRKKPTILTDEVGRTGMAFNEVQFIFEDRFGEIWIGHNHGATRFSPGKAGFTRYESTAFGLAESSVWYVTQFMEDHHGDLWAVTKGGGVHHFDRTSNTFSHLNKAGGLPHDNAYGMFEDETGRFWISTDRGITCFNPETRTFDLFGPSDGLQGNEFNRLSYFRSRDGELFFGGTNGLNSFYPKDIRRNLTPPKPVILEVASEARSFLPSAGGEPFSFPAFTRSLTVSFSALDFHAPEKNRYQYRLEGFDRDWSPSGPASEANYMNLPPGDYHFRVRAANNDGIWCESPATVHFRILPPWWRTWWAYTLYFTLFVAFAAFAFRFQANRLHARASLREAELRAAAAEIQSRALERENRQRTEAEAAILSKNLELEVANSKLRELDEIKRGFTAMLVHDLKSPLAVARGALELAEFSGEVKNPEVLSLLGLGQHSVDRVVGLVNEVLDVFKTDSEEISLELKPVDARDLLSACCGDARVMARAKNIAVVEEFTPSLPTIQADFDKIERVFANLVSNAIKFTPNGGTITLAAKTIAGTGVEEGLNLLLVTVTDTGEGIPAADLPYIFDPYRQSGNGQKKRGVGLGLAIVRRFVAAHGGNITVRSQIGVGSTFAVILPTVGAPIETPTTADVS